jgi:hypothetical protein
MCVSTTTNQTNGTISRLFEQGRADTLDTLDKLREERLRQEEEV